MNLLVVTLVCGVGIAPLDCSRDTALEILERGARDPIECMWHSDEMISTPFIARNGTYTKTVCEPIADPRIAEDNGTP